MNDPWFLLPCGALLLGVLALAPLGAQVLRRGVVFIDLAVAQAAAATALWASALLDHPEPAVIHGFAAIGALLCAAAVASVARRSSQQREALIGLLYVLGASLALLGARRDAHGRERLGELLAADVLWAGPQQLALIGLSALLVAATHRFLHRDAVFYVVFALVASLAVPVLGLFLVFATLIAPALWWNRRGSAVALTGSTLAAATGLTVSWMLDWPSGACVAVALSLFGAASMFDSRSDTSG